LSVIYAKYNAVLRGSLWDLYTQLKRCFILTKLVHYITLFYKPNIRHSQTLFYSGPYGTYGY
jgi:hypothetical protein